MAEHDAFRAPRAARSVKDRRHVQVDAVDGAPWCTLEILRPGAYGVPGARPRSSSLVRAGEDHVVKCLALLELFAQYSGLGPVKSPAPVHRSPGMMYPTCFGFSSRFTGTKIACPAADAPKMAVTVSIRLSRYTATRSRRPSPSLQQRVTKTAYLAPQLRIRNSNVLAGERRSFAPLLAEVNSRWCIWVRIVLRRLPLLKGEHIDGLLRRR